MIDILWKELVKWYGSLVNEDKTLAIQQDVNGKRYLAAINIKDERCMRELNKKFEELCEKRFQCERKMNFLELILDHYFA